MNKGKTLRFDGVGIAMMKRKLFSLYQGSINNYVHGTGLQGQKVCERFHGAFPKYVNNRTV